MEQLAIALGPAFAAGFAVQRLLEILDTLLGYLPEKDFKWYKDKKKIILGIISLGLGVGLAFGVGLTVLKPLGITNPPLFVDQLTTGLIVSAGTDGFNSILKFLGYTKESKKDQTATLSESVKSEPDKAQAVVRLQTAV